MPPSFPYALAHLVSRVQMIPVVDHFLTLLLYLPAWALLILSLRLPPSYLNGCLTTSVALRLHSEQQERRFQTGH